MRTLAGLTLLRRLLTGAALASEATHSSIISIMLEIILLDFIENTLV